MWRINIHNFRERISRVLSAFLEAYIQEFLWFTKASLVALSAFLFFAFLGAVIGDFILTCIWLALLISHLVYYSKASANLVKNENYPYQFLRSLEVLLKVMLGSIVVGIVSIIGVWATMSEPYGLLLSIFALSFAVAACLVVVSVLSFFASAYFLSEHKDSRLCFQFVLSILEKCKNEPKSQRRFATENFRFFRQAFKSLRSSLVGKPFNVELRNIDDYCDAIYLVAVAGSREEIKQTQRNLRLLLYSIGEKPQSMRLRESLITLEKLAQRSSDNFDTIAGLNKLCRTSSKLDRWKAQLKSPATAAIMSIIAIIMTLIQIYISKP